MRLDYHGPEPEPIGYLLIDQFSMMAFFSATEPLRIANRIAGRELFRWLLISEDGEAVTASNGMRLMVDHAIGEFHHLPSLSICSGFGAARGSHRALLAWLHRLDQSGCALGGIDTGCFLLAEAGLLANEQVTLHWESLPAFRERFPDVDTTEALFKIGSRRFSCAGGTAAMDMTLEMIAHRHGDGLAHAVAEQLIHARMRSRDDHQRQSPARRLNVHHRPLLKAIAMMETHLETPLALGELAEQVGLSARQLQRLFAHQLDSTPAQWYLTLRLARARTLLQDTDMTVIAVALSCGFSSSSSFSRAYRRHFGHPPRGERSPRDTQQPLL
ncbi:GlxA family transcriptional regulator [Kushneria phosphatilytica]|uniref:GlxA family transcriptional regulator n=1 Tax=Kushneria phosphatilytica TaxID=657387 RepID=A0A1S1NUL1_9GAMM|nr:GlxA family transcriptional regulator [Kushneria phosphatilytica]OHV09737.1 AraC family transcriptional regulator [Kushneria phosphatilytica]QEL11783.1 GlxA family transcriptional regulator [Kushneria phosphatilytica]